MRSFNKKCTSESSSERSVIAPQKSLTHVQTMVLDDIENWNPEVAVMMTPDEIKKQLIHTRSSKSTLNIFFIFAHYFHLGQLECTFGSAST